MMANAPGVALLQKCFKIGSSQKKRLILNRVLAVLFTYLAYMALHASRKPFSALKSTLKGNEQIQSSGDALNATVNTFNETVNGSESITVSFDAGWAPFNGNNSVLLFSIVDTVWSASYAVSMYGTGIIAEKTSLRMSLFLGLIGSGISCAFLGFSKYMNVHHLAYYITINLISGFTQSFGWPCVMAIMTNWFGSNKLGTITGLWSSHNFVGNIIGQVVAAAFIDINWALSFIIPGSVTILVGFLVLLFLNEDPKHIGIVINPVTPVEEEKNDKDVDNENMTLLPLDREGRTDETNENKLLLGDELAKSSMEEDDSTAKKDQTEKPIGFFKALLIPGVCEYALSLFCNKLVIYSFLFWLPLYINQTKIKNYNVTPTTSAYLASMFDFGSIIGAFVLGLLSDLTKNTSNCILCVSSQLFGGSLIILYSYYGSSNITLSLILLIFIGVFVNGAASLISTCVTAGLSSNPKLGNTKAKATVAAIINATGSVGAALSPFIIKAISDHGWNYVLYFLVAALFAGALFLIRRFLDESVKLDKLIRDKRLIKKIDENYLK